jgi:hypothetical protein
VDLPVGEGFGVSVVDLPVREGFDGCLCGGDFVVVIVELTVGVVLLCCGVVMLVLQKWRGLVW